MIRGSAALKDTSPYHGNQANDASQSPGGVETGPPLQTAPATKRRPNRTSSDAVAARQSRQSQTRRKHVDSRTSSRRGLPPRSTWHPSTAIPSRTTIERDLPGLGGARSKMLFPKEAVESTRAPRPVFLPNRPAFTYWTSRSAGRRFLSSVRRRYSRMWSRVSSPTMSTNSNGPIGWLSRASGLVDVVGEATLSCSM